MMQTRRQLLHQMTMLATVIGAGQVGSACAASPTAQSGPLTVVDLGNYRRGRTGSLPKIVRTPAQLVADRLVLPFDSDAVRHRDQVPSFTYRPGVYAEVGLNPNMPGTGERPEIGLVTEPQADWMMGASPDNMLVWAEAHGSIPVHAT